MQRASLGSLQSAPAHARGDALGRCEAAAPQHQRQLCAWLTANVIVKKSTIKKEALHWLAEPSIIKQRIFWSVQARTIKRENRELKTHV